MFSIHDDVVRWVKSVQKSVGRAGDLVLEELRSKTSAETLGIKFIGNSEFLQSLTPDKIGFFQEEKKTLSLGDVSLDLATPITSLKPNSEVKCQIILSKPCLEIPPLEVSFIKNGKEVGQIPMTSLPGFSVLVTEAGEYEVIATLHGRHVLGSPLKLPIASDAVLKDRLTMMGLGPLDSKVFIIKIFSNMITDYEHY